MDERRWLWPRKWAYLKLLWELQGRRRVASPQIKNNNLLDFIFRRLRLQFPRFQRQLKVQGVWQGTQIVWNYVGDRPGLLFGLTPRLIAKGLSLALALANEKFGNSNETLLPATALRTLLIPRKRKEEICFTF